MTRLPSYVLENAVVRTLDERGTVASSLVVRDGVVAPADAATSGLPRLDAGGRTVLPGLVDGHAHLDREGLRTVFASLEGVRSIPELLDRIASLVADAEPGAWIVTMPLGEPPYYRGVPDNLAEGRFPNRWELDRVAPDNPVLIRPIWGYWRHELPLVSVLNSAGLAAAGLIEDAVPPAPAVRFERSADGAPTGIVVEETPIPVLELFLPPETRFTAEHRSAALPRSMAAYAATGTTAVFEAHGFSTETLDVYRTASDLTVRTEAVLSPSWLDADPVGALRDGLAAEISGTGTGDDRFRLRGLFVEPHVDELDVVRARALPYTGWAGFSYAAGVRPDRVRSLLTAALDLDVRVVLMGTSLLPLLLELDLVTPLAGRRWVIGHVSTISAEEIAVIRALGLEVTTHTNRYLYKQSEALADELGDREHELVPLRSLLRAGVPVSFGTDNVPTSLWHPVWHAVARRGRATGRVVGPDERLTREQALRVATAGGAHLLGTEQVAGCLVPGRRADLTVLDRDPMLVPDDELTAVRSELTVVGDRIAWSSGEVWTPVR